MKGYCLSLKELLLIIKLLLKSKLYVLYGNHISESYIKENYPKNIYQVFEVLSRLHEDNQRDYSVEELKVSYLTLHPQDKTQETKDLFDKLSALSVDEKLCSSYLEAFKKHQIANQVVNVGLKVMDGSEPFLSLLEAIPDDVTESSILTSKEDLVASTNIEEIYKNYINTPGLRWRLNCLNKSLGSLREGDFGFIFARPECGKTTLMASEISFMVQNVERPILWFNNEEQSQKVVNRVYQAVLGWTKEDIQQNPRLARRKYLELTNDNIKIVDSVGLHKKEYGTFLKKYCPSLIVFDQLDKVRGFTDDRYDLELKAIYEWARNLAKEHLCPIIGVCQAGGSAEGKKYLTMDDVDSSKTGKQGEADFIIGIGKENKIGMEYIRGLSISKNKLSGDSDSDPKLRHGLFDVLIQPEIARYKDIMQL